MAAFVGVMLTETGGINITVAEAEALGLAALVAVIVTNCWKATVAGAV
jgi:hypothetical protein